MSPTSAMMLSLLVFAALLVGALVIIVLGGGFVRRETPKGDRHHTDAGPRKAA